MPYFPHLCAVVLAASTLMGATYAQHDVTVEENDSARAPTQSCIRLRDRSGRQFATRRHEGTEHLPGATVSLTFNGTHSRANLSHSKPEVTISPGSYIAYYSDKNNDHGSMTITLDNKTTTLNTFNAAGAVPQVKIFESFVDPDIPDHTITLTCLESWTMGLDYFIYTAATPAMKVHSLIASSTSSSITSPTLSSITSPIRHPAPQSLSTGPEIIVAALLAAIGAASKANQPEPQCLQHSMNTLPSLPAAITEHLSLPRSSRANESAVTREFAAGVCTDVLFPSEAVSRPRPPSTGDFAELPFSVAAATTRISLRSGPPAYSRDL
ncbi:hypothetical protein EXIGLDRAFT_699781 [Exidia glandulosa HHB12029]|uniref:DM13 domain-containing protein n=1 Tax=Exidia glandulosa HHB12029 TaxID=1314781 RepID=A0A165DPU7_EXIGL|nr:hypothetical protein EXIGLDRAFT_699781 [Exidia glandulosa HHB12029]